MITRRNLLTAAALAGAGAFGQKLAPPPSGSIPVAIVLSPGAVLIDYAGPWEVFQDAVVPGRARPFHLYTVAEHAGPIANSALKVTADYSFDNAPAPKIVVIPAQQGSDAMIAWLKKVAPAADLTMSVCTGAFQLGKTGLLDGKSATTHHASYVAFAKAFPKVNLKRGFRFVDEGNVASAGGLTSGIDLALHVVERYFGRDVATNTAYYMEYQGRGWMDASGAGNSEYAEPTAAAGADPSDPVCGMPVSKDTKFTTKRGEQTYYFCQKSCKDQFDEDPEAFVKAPGSGKMRR
ncbi:MAG TPA: YHS domain-containing protein [Bryobacteraceae bacterium]